MKIRYIAVSVIIIVILFASQAFLPISYHQVNTADGEVYWKKIAENAWQYFQPGVGVDDHTGLHSASLSWPHFTDWDLGVYIQAIIDAEKVGVESRDGPWGSDARIEKILSFLENRELTSDGLPYWWYNSGDGQKMGDGTPDAVDAGKLLVALNNLRLYRPDLANRINYLVNNRTNYVSMLKPDDQPAGPPSIYSYYVASGFAGFWPEKYSNMTEAILNKIISAPTVETYGVKLPESFILGDPLLYSIFELKYDSRLMDLAKQVYLAHEARYNATGKYVAFSEGNTGFADYPSYVYEWVVMPDGRTWNLTDQTYSPLQITPIVYFKVAVGFLAIYKTAFTQNMAGYLETNLPQPTNGYADGIDDGGRVVGGTYDKTNGLIISAARYAMVQTEKPTGDLGVFPRPFIQQGIAKNTTLVIGESEPHGPVGAAQTMDTIGGIFIAERLGRESIGEPFKVATDESLVTFDSESGNTSLLNVTSNLIVVGNPSVNVLSYYYNNLKNAFGEPLVPVAYRVDSAGAQSYLYVPSSGSTYKAEFDSNGKIVTNYGVIMVFQDKNGCYVALVYGLDAEGTAVVCKALQNYDKYNLYGSAVILKFSSGTLENSTSTVSIAEVVS